MTILFVSDGLFGMFMTSLCIFCFKEHAGPFQVSHLLIFILNIYFETSLCGNSELQL
jgi:hypothetical protein